MQTEILKVTGMTCGGCTRKVTDAINAIHGVGDVKVSLASGEATVQYDEGVATPAQLKSAVKDAGYGTEVTSSAENQPVKRGCCG